MSITRTVNGKTQYYWGGMFHTVPNPYGGSGMFEGVTINPDSIPTPPSATPATPSTPPQDPNAENRRILINQNLANTQGNIDTQEATLKRQYGLDDKSDPFSRAQLLKESYDNRTRGSTNSYAASGQLYAGSLQNAQNTNTNNYNQGYDSLRKQQTAQIGGLENQRQTAIFNAAMGNLDQDSANVAFGLNNPPTPADLPQVLAPQPVTTSLSIRSAKRGKRGK